MKNEFESRRIHHIMKACSICKIEKDESEFNIHSSKFDRLQSHCKICNKIRSKMYYAANLEKHKLEIGKRKKKVVKENIQYVWDYLKEHPCVDCGETDPIVLEFDHVRGEKKTSVSNLSRAGHCLETLVDEISKCDVRCANCHRRKTAKQFGWYSTIMNP